MPPNQTEPASNFSVPALLASLSADFADKAAAVVQASGWPEYYRGMFAGMFAAFVCSGHTDAGAAAESYLATAICVRQASGERVASEDIFRELADLVVRSRERGAE